MPFPPKKKQTRESLHYLMYPELLGDTVNKFLIIEKRQKKKVLPTKKRKKLKKT